MNLFIDKIFYINLDNRVDRKDEIEAELHNFELPFERFSAIKHDFGAIGCSKSHLEVLKLARDRKYNRILILEDDFTFIVSKEEFQKEIQTIHESNITYDVCMVSYNVIKSEDTQQPFWKKIIDSQTTIGYIVNSHYYNVLINVIEYSIPFLEQTHNKNLFAVDMIFKLLQSRDNWYHTTKRIGIQRPGYSDIENINVDYKV